MENLAYYSSNGRIRQLIIFDTENIEGEDENAVIEALKNKYDSFIEKLNEDRISDSEITVWVFYMTDKDDLVIPECLKNNSGWGCFLQAQDGFNTVWVQDVMHVVKEGEGIQLLLEFDIGGELLRKINSEIPVLVDKVKSIRFVNNLPHGGDYARIKSSNGNYINDYGIDGASIGQNVSVTAPAQLDINPQRYFTLVWQQLSTSLGSIAKQKFFHLDLYMTFVGQDIESKTNIILLPHFIYEHSTPFPEFCEMEKKIWSFPSELMSLGMSEDMSFIFIPLIRLSTAIILSYNNCLVENYAINSMRQIRIYFPDYRSKAQVVIKKALSGEESSNGNKISWNELKSDLESAYATYFPEKANPLTSTNIQSALVFEPDIPRIGLRDFEKIAIDTVNEIIDKAEEEISQKLSAWNIKINFVNLSCDYYAERQGSLHCLTKIIDRDCQP